MTPQPARHAYVNNSVPTRSSGIAGWPARRSASQSSIFHRRSQPAIQRNRPTALRNDFRSPEANNHNKSGRLQHRNWQRTVKFIFFILVLLIFVSAHSYYLLVVPRANNISCVHTDGTPCSQTITDILKNNQGRLLYLLSDQKIQQSIQQMDPTVHRVNVLRRLPSALEVSIEKEQPLFLIEKDGQHFAVFPSQQVLPAPTSEQLPVIHASAELSWSDNMLNTQLFTSLKELTQFNWQSLPITSISFVDATQIEILLRNKKILFALYEIERQLILLSILQQQPALFEKNWVELDLRFDKPVVKYQAEETPEASSSGMVKE